jgi:hypothetical protein
MKREYKRHVNEGLARTAATNSAIITEHDLGHLPSPVRKYLELAGVPGKEKVMNFRATFTGRIRGSEKSGWMPLKSEQYNFFDQPSRYFFIKAKKMGLNAIGLHKYEKEQASMVIKLAGLFRIVDARGPKMDQAETVTLFNDMCVMAPATLINPSITWENIDDLSVGAVYRNGKIAISATLFFNEKGELINFLSNDRFETDGKIYNNYPWVTPLRNYKSFNGINLGSEAELIYRRPEGEFCYGEFKLTGIEYNCR